MEKKSFKVSEKAHELLVARAAYLTLELGRKVSLTEALDVALGVKEAQSK